MPLLDIRKLSVEARSEDGSWQAVVKSVDLQIAQGQVLGLVGESGSGKSTIALASLAYFRPGCRRATGEILFDGQNLTEFDRRELRQHRGLRAAYVAQSPSAGFDPARTVGFQVTETARLHGVLGKVDAFSRMADLCRRVGLPQSQEIRHRYPHQLSGGQLQRLQIAMALLCRPALLVLDEPTTAIDVSTQLEVLIALRDVVRSEGVAALFVSHDFAVLAQLADRMLVLKDGQVIEEGPVEAILHQPRQAYTRALVDAVTHFSTNAEPETAPLEREECALLRLRDVDASIGGVAILKDIDLTIDAGAVVGVVGESGSGKSTLARVIAGLLPATRGTVALRGVPLPATADRRTKESLRQIQILFQMADLAFNPRRTILEAIGRPLAFYFGLTGADLRRRIIELLGLVGLPGSMIARYPSELSGGQKQRVNLARALAADPDLLLCDEIISSLDPVVAAGVVKLIADLRLRLGKAFFFISHDLSTVAMLADHTVVMLNGRIVESGPTAKVLQPPYHPYTRILLQSVPQCRTDWLDSVDRPAALGSRRETRPAPSAAGCPFVARCSQAIRGICIAERPPLRTLPGGHSIVCHRSVAELMAPVATPQIEKGKEDR